MSLAATSPATPALNASAAGGAYSASASLNMERSTRASRSRDAVRLMQKRSTASCSDVNPGRSSPSMGLGGVCSLRLSPNEGVSYSSESTHFRFSPRVSGSTSGGVVSGTSLELKRSEYSYRGEPESSTIAAQMGGTDDSPYEGSAMYASRADSEGNTSMASPRGGRYRPARAPLRIDDGRSEVALNSE